MKYRKLTIINDKKIDINKILKKNNLSVRELAKIVGVNHMYIQIAKTQAISENVYNKIVKTLNAKQLLR